MIQLEDLELEQYDAMRKREYQHYLYEFNIYDPLRKPTQWEIKRTEKNRQDEVENMKREEMKKFDVTKYVGTKATIVSAEVIATKYGEAIKCQTNPIDLKDGDKLPDGKLLSASILLGLQKNDDGELFIGIGSKIDKWLEGKGINVEKDFPESVKVGSRIANLEGLEVVCQKNENGFLEIA